MFRVISGLQIINQEAVKTVEFGNPNYIGDPINIIRILNAKGSQEILVQDIAATQSMNIDFDYLALLAEEAFVPFGYGGGINEKTTPDKLTKLGVERFYINTLFYTAPNFVRNLVDHLGSSSVCISLDLKYQDNSWKSFYRGGRELSTRSLSENIDLISKLAPGEVVFKLIDFDGLKGNLDIQKYIDLSNELSRYPELSRKQMILSCGIFGGSMIKSIETQTIFDGILIGSQICYSDSRNAANVLISYPKEYSVGG